MRVERLEEGAAKLLDAEGSDRPLDVGVEEPGRERIGLVNKVVPHDELMAATGEMAQKILSKGPLAIRLAKVVMNARIKGGQEAAMLVERFAQSCLMTTEDKIEGTSAFLEKRTPEFKGR